jgi:hypothetical protein
MKRYLNLLFIIFFSYTASSQCTYVIDMQDSFGDGWNGCNLDVTVNGSFFGNYTLNGGSTGQASFSVNNLDVVAFTYNIGSYNSEVSYQISVGGAQLFADGQPVAVQPTGGLVFTHQCGGCDPVGNLTATNITTTTADFGWTTSSSTNFIVEYGPTGFTPGTGTTVGTTNNPYTATGLPSGTTMDYYVQQICTSSGDTSIQSSLFTFTTLCAAILAPWSEDFSTTSTPNCWTESGSEAWRYTTTAGFAAASAGDHSGNGSNYAWIDGSSPSGASQISTLAGPMIDVSGLPSPILSYWVFSHNSNGTGYNTLECEFYDGAGWNTLNTVNSSQGTNWTNLIFDLTAFSITGPVQVRFTITENSPSNSLYNDILIDDIEIKDAPNISLDNILGLQASYCNNPIVVDLVVSNTSGNTEYDIPWIIESANTVINSGSIISLAPFSSDTIPVVIGIYPANPNADIVAYVNLLADQNSSDDSISAFVEVSFTSINATMSATVGCLGGSDGAILSDGNGGLGQYTYLWGANAANQITAEATGLSAGTYTVTVTDTIGCASTATLTLLDPPSALISTDTSSDINCFGNNNGWAMITASGGVPAYTYAWSNGNNSSQITNVGANTYTVTVTDVFGCEISSSVTITEPASAVTATITNNGNGSLTASGSGGSGSYTFLWNSLAGNQTTATATGLTSGTYTVVVSDANGCNALFTLDIIVVGHTAIINNNSIVIFPNPASDNVFVDLSLSESSAIQINILNLTGQVLLSKEYTANKNDRIELSTATMLSGVYTIQLTIGTEQVSRKLIIVK